MNLYAAQKVQAGYDGRIVLRDIDLEIGTGEFVGVIGPNGAGKSTLLKVLSRALRPVRGSVTLKGIPLEKYGARELAREVAVVHQLVENMPPFSVREFVRMGRFPHQRPFEVESGADRERVELSIETMGIGHLMNRALTELSGGERQLVYIARALAQGSAAIMLDEPVSHLDIRHAVQIMDILFGLRASGTTVIAVLHDINIAADYCSRIVALKDGSIFAGGVPSEMINYALIEALFDTVCIVIENPLTKKPFTFPVPGYIKTQG